MHQYWPAENDDHISDVMSVLEDHPDHMYVFENKATAMVFREDTGDFLLLLGDFSGTPEECNEELQRLLNLM